MAAYHVCTRQPKQPKLRALQSLSYLDTLSILSREAERWCLTASVLLCSGRHVSVPQACLCSQRSSGKTFADSVRVCAGTNTIRAFVTCRACPPVKLRVYTCKPHMSVLTRLRSYVLIPDDLQFYVSTRKQLPLLHSRALNARDFCAYIRLGLSHKRTTSELLVCIHSNFFSCGLWYFMAKDIHHFLELQYKMPGNTFIVSKFSRSQSVALIFNLRVCSTF